MDDGRTDGFGDDGIFRVRARFTAELARRDANAAAEVYARTARLLAPSAELIEGREAIAAFWHAGLEAGLSSLALEPLAVDRHHCIAYEFGRYTLRVEPLEGGAVLDRGTYAVVHERQDDGSWLRAMEALSPDSQPARVAHRGSGARDLARIYRSPLDERRRR